MLYKKNKTQNFNIINYNKPDMLIVIYIYSTIKNTAILIFISGKTKIDHFERKKKEVGIEKKERTSQLEQCLNYMDQMQLSLTLITYLSDPICTLPVPKARKKYIISWNII